MKVLIVEDDLSVRQALVQGISEVGFQTEAVKTAERAVRFIKNDPPDLIVLDLGLPGRDGHYVLSTLRDAGDRTPVIILTARDALDDRVQGLDAGADDYLVKPFAFAELLARIRARLRTRNTERLSVISVGDLVIDTVRRKVKRGGTPIDLTLKEYDLLRYLAEHAGQTVSREMLARDVWQIASRATPLDNVIDVHMSHLRRKIDSPNSTPLIHTIRGVGFALRESS